MDDTCIKLVEPEGIEPSFPQCHRGVLPLNYGPGETGAHGRDRTPDLRIICPPLYQLSYTRMWCFQQESNLRQSVISTPLYHLTMEAKLEEGEGIEPLTVFQVTTA